ncbi:lytic transglycosylase domain-containing protein [Paenibacillus larvae]
MNVDPRIIRGYLKLQTMQSETSVDNRYGLIPTKDNTGFSRILESALQNNEDTDSAAQAYLLTGGMPSQGGSSMKELNALIAKAESGLRYKPAQEKASAAIGTSTVWNGKVDAPHPSGGKMGKTTPYDSIIREASRETGVEESLIKAIIYRESSFNPNTVSSAGAKGLMQLMDFTSKAEGVSNPFDPKQNILAGTRHLYHFLKTYNGNLLVALAAYNAGPTRVNRLGIKTDKDLMANLHKLPKETQNYIGRVMDSKKYYETV